MPVSLCPWRRYVSCVDGRKNSSASMGGRKALTLFTGGNPTRVHRNTQFCLWEEHSSVQGNNALMSLFMWEGTQASMSIEREIPGHLRENKSLHPWKGKHPSPLFVPGNQDHVSDMSPLYSGNEAHGSHTSSLSLKRRPLCKKCLCFVLSLDKSPTCQTHLPEFRPICPLPENQAHASGISPLFPCKSGPCIQRVSSLSMEMSNAFALPCSWKQGPCVRHTSSWSLEIYPILFDINAKKGHRRGAETLIQVYTR